MAAVENVTEQLGRWDREGKAEHSYQNGEETNKDSQEFIIHLLLSVLQLVYEYKKKCYYKLIESGKMVQIKTIRLYVWLQLKTWQNN